MKMAVSLIILMQCWNKKVIHVKFNVKYQSGKSEYITLEPAIYSYNKNIKRLYGYDKYDKLAYVEMNQAYMDWDTPKERKRFLKRYSKYEKTRLPGV